MSDTSGISGIQPAVNDLCYAGDPIIVVLNKPSAPQTSRIIYDVLLEAFGSTSCWIVSRSCFLVMVKCVPCRGVNLRLARDTIGNDFDLPLIHKWRQQRHWEGLLFFFLHVLSDSNLFMVAASIHFNRYLLNQRLNNNAIICLTCLWCNQNSTPLLLT